jgi:hypothetical protein
VACGSVGSSCRLVPFRTMQRVSAFVGSASVRQRCLRRHAGGSFCRTPVANMAGDDAGSCRGWGPAVTTTVRNERDQTGDNDHGHRCSGHPRNVAVVPIER